MSPKESTTDEPFGSNPGHQLDPVVSRSRLTTYYNVVAANMLLHLADHPLTLKPISSEMIGSGLDDAEDLETVASGESSTALQTIEISHSNGDTTSHAICNQSEQIASLALQGTISVYRWASTAIRPDHPRYLIFDLNPAMDDFRPVRICALRLRDQLQSLKLEPFVMTTGGHGLHVLTPILPEHPYPSAKNLASAIARLMAEKYPEEITTEQRSDRRHGRTYIDIVHNGFGQVSIAPYSVRSHSGAPVATPITWQELEESVFSARQFNIVTLPQLLQIRPDPWRSFEASAVSLKTPEALLRTQIEAQDRSSPPL